MAEAIFWFVFLLGLAITGGLIAQSAYAFSVRSDIRWQVFGLLNVYALASFFVGGFFGFIFGVPRTGAMTEGRDPVLPNTNLEQISDWLTKVLVGATLANMNEIPSGGDSIFTAMGQALGTGASGKAFASGLTIFAAVLGFMSSWLATRGLMGRVLLAADLGGQPRGRQRDHKEQDAEVDGVSTTSQ
ncbi:hypothetical protein [Nocardia vaccinii]|uniref:hypothetical protein n=1 Tax=Nocardia vaccinii TaxID=1822 RepID=UPI00082ED14E|nr:hypothetical protein [Nocardia vaccinii]